MTVTAYITELQDVIRRIAMARPRMLRAFIC